MSDCLAQRGLFFDPNPAKVHLHIHPQYRSHSHTQSLSLTNTHNSVSRSVGASALTCAHSPLALQSTTAACRVLSVYSPQSSPHVLLRASVPRRTSVRSPRSTAFSRSPLPCALPPRAVLCFLCYLAGALLAINARRETHSRRARSWLALPNASPRDDRGSGCARQAQWLGPSSGRRRAVTANAHAAK